MLGSKGLLPPMIPDCSVLCTPAIHPSIRISLDSHPTFMLILFVSYIKKENNHPEANYAYVSHKYSPSFRIILFYILICQFNLYHYSIFLYFIASSWKVPKLLKVYHNCACFARTNFVKTSSAVIFFRRISCLHEKMPGKAPIERHLMSKK